MNLQYAKTRLTMMVFRGAVVIYVIAALLWSMNADAVPGEYEPSPPKTTAQTLMELGDSCLNRETMVLSVTNKEGKRIYLTFLCKFQFASEQSPEGK